MSDYKDYLTDDTLIELCVEALKKQVPQEFRSQICFSGITHREIITAGGIERRSQVHFETIWAPLEKLPPDSGSTDCGAYASYYAAPVRGVNTSLMIEYPFSEEERTLLRSIGKISEGTSTYEYLAC